MKTLMQRFTKWFNRTHARTGNLWEDAFKSVIVEDGVAAKPIAAYIDLNPVRASMVKDPADYRWSSHGEVIGGGTKGNGKKARAGLVRALRAHQGCCADGAVIGSRSFVNEAFAGARERFGSRRKDGARKMGGSGATAAGIPWSTRDLKRGIG